MGSGASGYFAYMVPHRARTDGFIDPCVPALAAKPPSGPGWVHEIKHDGYGLIVRRDGEAGGGDGYDELTSKVRSCMLRGAAGGKPMSIDAEEAAIRTAIVGALVGHSEVGERGFDALFAMRQAEAIVKALKIGGYEIKRASR